MNSFISKASIFLEISVLYFALFAFTGEYARSCDESTEYCGQSLSLFNALPPDVEMPDFLLTSIISTIIQFGSALLCLVFSEKILNFERLYGISLLIGIIGGSINIIYFWVILGDKTLENFFKLIFIRVTENEIYVGVGVIASAIVVLIQILLLIKIILTA